MSELAGFAGTLQATGFSGYNQLCKGGAIREAACLAHLRRKIFDVHDSQPTELSTTGHGRYPGDLPDRGRDAGLPPAERLAARRRRTRPWSARCDDSSRARARVCRAMPMSRMPSPKAPNDGARSIASTMASSSPTT
ncbi:transposase [Mesorhizobium sp.]